MASLSPLLGLGRTVQDSGEAPFEFLSTPALAWLSGFRVSSLTWGQLAHYKLKSTVCHPSAEFLQLKKWGDSYHSKPGQTPGLIPGPSRGLWKLRGLQVHVPWLHTLVGVRRPVLKPGAGLMSHPQPLCLFSFLSFKAHGSFFSVARCSELQRMGLRKQAQDSLSALYPVEDSSLACVCICRLLSSSQIMVMIPFI